MRHECAPYGWLVGAYGVTMQALDQMADSLMDRGMADVNGGALVLRGCAG